MTDLGTNLTIALRHATELNQAPTLALAAAATPDPAGNGQAVTQAANNANTSAAGQGVEKKHGGGFLSDAISWIGGGLSRAASAVNDATGGIVGNALKIANMPLQEVTHEYRYLHDVESRHGLGDAILEGLGVGAGAIAGGFAGAFVGDPVHGAILGAEATGELGRLVHPDSWDRTEAGYVDPSTGKPVSPGRDLASVLGVGNGFWTSGLVDGLFDVAADPLAVGGKLVKARGVQALTPAGVTSVERASDVERIAASSGAYQRWAQTVAGMDAGTIAARFPWVGRVTAPTGDAATGLAAASGVGAGERLPSLAQRLGAATTPDAVTDVVRNAVGAREMLGPLPSIQLNRVPFQKLNEAILNYSRTENVVDPATGAVTAGPAVHVGGDALNAVRSKFTSIPVFYDSENHAITNRFVDPSSPQFSNVVYHEMRYGFDDQTARQLANAVEQAPTLAQKLLIRKNGLVDMMVHMGLPEDGNVIRRFRGAVDDAQGVGQEGQYGTDIDGRNLSKVVDPLTGNTTPAAILQSQTGVVPIVDYQAVRHQVQQLNKVWKATGAVDDFAYDHFTGNIFKPLVLLSGGTAERLALAEALPAGLRYGFVNLLKSAVSSSVAKLGDRSAQAVELARQAADASEVASLAGDATDTAAGSVASATRAATEAEAAAKSAELPFFANAVRRALGDNPKFLTDPGRLEAAAMSLQSTGGYAVDPALDMTRFRSVDQIGPHGAIVDGVYRLSANQPETRLGDAYLPFGRDSSEFTDRWQRHLSATSKDPASQAAATAYARAAAGGASVTEATSAGAQAATDWLKAQPDLSAFMRTQSSTTGDAVDPLADWGRVVMENVKGATHSPRITDAAGQVVIDAAPNGTLINNVATGRVTTKGFLDSLAYADRPLVVPGREAVIMHDGTIDRIANFGWSRVLGPVINHLARQPIYNEEFYRQWTALKPLIDGGELDAADAARMANEQAVKNVIPFIHNPDDRSQFALMARNLFPFYFAQVQAYRRYGHLLADDPGAFRRFQLMSSSLANMGHTVQDANGQNQFVIPAAGFLDQGVIGALNTIGVPATQMAGSVPVAFSGQLRSLASVFPFSEGVGPKPGPFLTIPSHLLENLFPESRPAIDTALGFGSTSQGAISTSGSIWDSLIPNQFVKNLVNGVGEVGNGFHNSVLSTMQDLQYQQDQAMAAWTAAGHQPTDPGHPSIVPLQTDGSGVRQDFINRVKNQTRMNYIFKAFLSLVSPAAPTVNIGDLGLESDVRRLIADKGISAGLTEFLRAHPNATAYTVFHSKANDGTIVPATMPAEDWINAHYDLVHNQFPAAAPWLIPQPTTADPYSSSAYNEQLAQGLRHRKAYDEYANDLYAAAGNQQYFGVDLPTYDRALAQLYRIDPALVGTPGWSKALQAAHNRGTADPTAVAQLRTDFNKYLATFGLQNPIWYDKFLSKDTANQRLQTVAQLQQMFATNQAPPGQMSDALRGLVTDYDTYVAAQMPGRTDGAASQSRAQLREEWQAYLQQLAVEQPQLAPVINTVFRHL